jgi:hypothetical protein
VISVCICTYNRAESPQRTLDSLAGQNEINLGAIVFCLLMTMYNLGRHGLQPKHVNNLTPFIERGASAS